MNQADRPSIASVAGIMLCIAAALGCRPAPTEPPVAAPIAPVVATTTEPATCPSGLRFADYAWVPDDARMATSIQRDDPQLSAALTTLARMTEAPEVTLPSFATLEFRNLPLQLANLDRVLEEFGDDPAELIELHSPAGELVWLWPSACPPALVAARVLDRWQIMLRADLEHPGVRYGAGSADRFPFDVLTIATLDEQRVALTRVGHGVEVGAWLREAARGGEQGPGRALAELDMAPVRSVLGDASSLTTITHHRVRVTSNGWDDDAQ